jgi:predicted RNA-binding Zn-ribbon protein involved in translation (DUF1610 family)
MIKCKECGFEAPVISNTGPEFINVKAVNEHMLDCILKCPKCGKEQ